MLQAEGFDVRPYSRPGVFPTVRSGEADLQWGGPIWGGKAYVWWKADKTGRLTEVVAYLDETGLVGGLHKL